MFFLYIALVLYTGKQLYKKKNGEERGGFGPEVRCCYGGTAIAPSVSTHARRLVKPAEVAVTKAMTRDGFVYEEHPRDVNVRHIVVQFPTRTAMRRCTHFHCACSTTKLLPRSRLHLPRE